MFRFSSSLLFLQRPAGGCLNRSKLEHWTLVYLANVPVFIKPRASVLDRAAVDRTLLVVLASFTEDKHKLSSSFEDANN